MFANFDGSYESIADKLNDEYLRTITDITKTVRSAHLKDEELNIKLCEILQREIFILAFSDIIAVDEQDMISIRESLNILTDFPKTNSNQKVKENAKSGFIFNQWALDEFIPYVEVRKNLILGINMKELHHKLTFIKNLSKIDGDDTYADLINTNIDKILEKVDMLDLAYKSIKRSVKIYNDYLEKIEGIFNSTKYTWCQKVDLLEYIMDIQYSDNIGNMYYHQSLLHTFNSFDEAKELVDEISKRFKNFSVLMEYVKCDPRYSPERLTIEDEGMKYIKRFPEYIKGLNHKLDNETQKKISALMTNSEKEFQNVLTLINPVIVDIPKHIYDEEKIRWIMSESRANFWEQYMTLLNSHNE